MLKMIARLIRVLNSEANPVQISLALVMGLIVGLTPLLSVHNLILVLLACILRVNFSTFLLALTFFSGVAYLLDPLYVSCGEALLGAEILRSFWTALYQSDMWRLTHFNNTVTLGSLAIALALSIPAFVLSKVLIVRYRVHIMTWVQKTRAMKILRASRFYDIYSRLEGGS